MALVLLALVAFALGIAAERWLNGAAREEALRSYERAVREYGAGHMPSTTGRP